MPAETGFLQLQFPATRVLALYYNLGCSGPGPLNISWSHAAWCRWLYLKCALQWPMLIECLSECLSKINTYGWHRTNSTTLPARDSSCMDRGGLKSYIGNDIKNSCRQVIHPCPVKPPISDLTREGGSLGPPGGCCFSSAVQSFLLLAPRACASFPTLESARRLV